VHLDPAAFVVVSYNRALIFLYQAKFEEAQRELDRAASVEPNNPLLKTVRALVLYYTKHAADAEALLREIVTDHPNLNGVRPFLAMSLSRQGKHDQAQAELTEAVKRNATVDPDIAYAVASVYALEGDTATAFEWLERSVALGNANTPCFAGDPNLKPLRDDARFVQLMNKLSH